MADVAERKIHFYVSATDKREVVMFPESATTEDIQADFEIWLANKVDAGWNDAEFGGQA
jgi:hypothetical protein